MESHPLVAGVEEDEPPPESLLCLFPRPTNPDALRFQSVGVDDGTSPSFPLSLPALSPDKTDNFSLSLHPLLSFSQERTRRRRRRTRPSSLFDIWVAVNDSFSSSLLLIRPLLFVAFQVGRNCAQMRE